jgi:hypothetical protein
MFPPKMYQVLDKDTINFEIIPYLSGYFKLGKSISKCNEKNKKFVCYKK